MSKQVKLIFVITLGDVELATRSTRASAERWVAKNHELKGAFRITAYRDDRNGVGQ